MSALSIMLLVVAALVIIYILNGIKIVSQSETMIVERLGRYHRTLQAGINVISEKPMTVDADKCQEIIDANPNVNAFVSGIMLQSIRVATSFSMNFLLWVIATSSIGCVWRDAR